MVRRVGRIIASSRCSWPTWRTIFIVCSIASCSCRKVGPTTGPAAVRRTFPKTWVHRTKPQIALELYDRAQSNGVVFEWLTFDELYGHNREFLTGLRQRQQKYVAEVPVTFTGWVQSPQVTHRTYRRCAYRGRARKTPRCVQGTPHPQSVREHLQSSPELRDQLWHKFRIKIPHQRRRERPPGVGSEASLVLSPGWPGVAPGTGPLNRGSQRL